MCNDSKKQQNSELQESISINIGENSNTDKDIEKFKKLIFINTMLGICEELYKEHYKNIDADYFDIIYPSSFFQLKLFQDTFEANIIEHLDDILETKKTYIYVVHNIQKEKRRFLIEIENNNTISHIYTENHKELSIVEEDYIKKFAEIISVKINRDENSN